MIKQFECRERPANPKPSPVVLADTQREVLCRASLVSRSSTVEGPMGRPPPLGSTVQPHSLHAEYLGCVLTLGTF